MRKQNTPAVQSDENYGDDGDADYQFADIFF